MPQFSWQPIYEKIARKLLEFEHRRPELLAILESIAALGLPILNPRANQPSLQEIDPLTFLAAFNRQLADGNRIKIIREIQQRLGLAPELPDDFDGIPVVNNMKSMFFCSMPPKKADIDDLWAVVRAALGPAATTMDPAAFNRTVKHLGFARMTIGLYWLRPDKFLPLDSQTTAFLSKFKIPHAASNWTSYQAVLNAVKSSWLGSDFPAISATAVDVAVAAPRTLPTAPGVTPPPFAKPLEPTNKILYGPPGTGKTFATIDEALKIIDPAFHTANAANRAALKKHYDSFVESGQIGFVTFHQSFSYEDFVEGLRAESDEASGALRYPVVGGVFRQMCERASALPVAVAKALGVGKNPRIWKISLDRAEPTTRKYCLDNGEARVGWGYVGDLRQADLADPEHDLGPNNQNSLRNFSQEIQQGDILLCLGSVTEIAAVGVVQSDYIFEEETPPEVHDEFQHCLKVKWLLQDLKFSILALNGGVQLTQQTVYELRRFSWTELLLALKAAGHALPTADGGPASTIPVAAQPYVLVIDEINRGNVSRIFGELITLIEPSKRRGQPEALEVMLPYSKKPFSVPSNLHLIGTMNTADRSLSQLDIALRRRFVFQEMPPQPKLLDGVVVDGVSIGQLLRVMNERIEVLLDRDHCLGHTYFLPLTATKTLSKLSEIFRQQILPLLQEYFFEDWQKIAWVLNDHRKNADLQMLRQPVSNIAELFGSAHTEVNDRRWCICPDAFNKIESYQGIIP